MTFVTYLANEGKAWLFIEAPNGELNKEEDKGVCGEWRRVGEGVWRVEESGRGCVESGGEWERVCGEWRRVGEGVWRVGEWERECEMRYKSLNFCNISS